MNRHVEVVRLELVGHLSEGLQRVLLLRLLEPERLHRLRHLGRDALRASPVALRNLGQGRHEAEGVVRVVAAVAEQHLLLSVALAAVLAHVLGQLKCNRGVF